MNALLLGVAMLVASTGASPALEPPRAAIRPVSFSFEVPESALRDVRGNFLRESFGPRRDRGRLPAAQAARSSRSRVVQIIAVAAGATIGFVAGGRIGYAVTPKRGPHDDTSGLKGVMIGAPIGAVAGALIGYRLTK